MYHHFSICLILSVCFILPPLLYIFHTNFSASKVVSFHNEAKSWHQDNKTRCQAYQFMNLHDKSEG